MSFWTAMEVLKSLVLCVLLIYGRDRQFIFHSDPKNVQWKQRNGMEQVCGSLIFGAISQFLVLTREHGYRKQRHIDDNTWKRKSIWIFEYMILFVFIFSIITFEILYNISMVFTNMSTQVKGCPDTGLQNLSYTLIKYQN